MNRDRLLRRMVPSVPVLARTPLAALLDFADFFIIRANSKWRHLPPASLRMRVGVGNRILRNHQQFIDYGRLIVARLRESGSLTRDSDVLELGCGCGRNAIAFAEYLSEQGSYIGQDVDSDMIRWCEAHLGRSNIRFIHADIYSKVYNPRGTPMSDYVLPMEDRSCDLVLATSVFTHLLHPEFSRYVGEIARLLRPGGTLFMTLFIHEYMIASLGGRWTFAHRMGQSYVEDVRFPEAAVAYSRPTVEKLVTSYGLRLAEIRDGYPQQTVIVVKE
jgi:SAM-dependent methyltransferase